jgi:hypothetical protein
MSNELDPRTPPVDASDWVRIIATISTLLSVRFVWNERGQWKVSRAEDPPPAEPVGSMGGGVQIEPVDRRAEVRQALLDHGKPVE